MVQEYVSYQRRSHHPELRVNNCGLFISEHNNWLAATPDGIVHDPSDTAQPLGTPFLGGTRVLMKPASILFAWKWTKKPKKTTKSTIKYNVSYTALARLGVTLVVSTTLDLHIEHIYQDRKWWGVQLATS